mmetsp:Transcript_306/g.792  ORF Transcript_306/g.792 Transcript_306/m.792 type:complete len:334 (+) Transcript_306:803-1804(+)
MRRCVRRPCLPWLGSGSSVTACATASLFFSEERCSTRTMRSGTGPRSTCRSSGRLRLGMASPKETAASSVLGPLSRPSGCIRRRISSQAWRSTLRRERRASRSTCHPCPSRRPSRSPCTSPTVSPPPFSTVRRWRRRRTDSQSMRSSSRPCLSSPTSVPCSRPVPPCSSPRRRLSITCSACITCSARTTCSSSISRTPCRNRSLRTSASCSTWPTRPTSKRTGQSPSPSPPMTAPARHMSFCGGQSKDPPPEPSHPSSSSKSKKSTRLRARPRRKALTTSTSWRTSTARRPTTSGRPRPETSPSNGRALDRRKKLRISTHLASARACRRQWSS